MLCTRYSKRDFCPVFYFWILERNDFSNSESPCLPDASHQLSAQTDLRLLTVIKELAIAWILCGRLHALLSTQSLLMAMLHSLIALRRFGPQTQRRPLRKTLTSGLGLDDMSLAWPAVFQLLVFIYSGIQQN